MPDTSDFLELRQASEVRDADGKRVYGSFDTLRRDYDRGILPLEMRGGKYVARISDLDALSAKRAARRAARQGAKAKAKASGADELEAAALRIAAEAPALSPARREHLRELLGGLVPAGGGARV